MTDYTPPGYIRRTIRCLSCTGEHEDLLFGPIADRTAYDWFALCPTTGQPMQYNFEVKNDRQHGTN